MEEDKKKNEPVYPVKEGGIKKNFKKIGYMLWKAIGKGAFGIVWKARVISGAKKDEYVAIKTVNLDDIKKKKIEEVRVS